MGTPAGSRAPLQFWSPSSTCMQLAVPTDWQLHHGGTLARLPLRRAGYSVRLLCVELMKHLATRYLKRSHVRADLGGRRRARTHCPQTRALRWATSIMAVSVPHFWQTPIN